MQKDFQNIRRLTLAATKNDGAYYYFARQLHINENTLTLLYALGDGQAHSQKQVCDDWLLPKTTVSTNVRCGKRAIWNWSRSKTRGKRRSF